MADNKEQFTYLGRPSDGLFYFQNTETEEIAIVKTQDEVDRFTSVATGECPPHMVIRNTEPIMIYPLDVREKKLLFAVKVQVTYYGHGGSWERTTLIEPEDLDWLIAGHYISTRRVAFHKGFESLRRLMCTMLIFSNPLFTELKTS